MVEIVLNTGGRRLLNEDLQALQDLSKSFESFYAGRDPFVISGVDLTNTSGTVYTISSGFVWLGNRIRVFAGANEVDLATDQYINAQDNSSSRLYTDAISREASKDYATALSSTFVSTERSLKISASTPVRRYVQDVVGSDVVLKNPVALSQTIAQEVNFSGKVRANDTLEVSGGLAVIGGNLDVGSNSSFKGGFQVSGSAAIFNNGVNVMDGLSASGGIAVSGDASFNSDLSVGGSFIGNEATLDSTSVAALTVRKTGGFSTITFPATTNDVGRITHIESNNAATMRFAAGDDNSTNDLFEFGYGAENNWNGTLRIYATGRLDVNSLEVVDSNGSIAWARLKNQVSVFTSNGLSGGGDLSTNRTISISTDIITSNTFVGSGGVNTSGLINTSNEYRLDNVDVINTASQFVGPGGVNTNGVINTWTSYRIDNTDVINTSRQFVGSGGVDTIGVINTSNEYRIDDIDVINTSRQFVGGGGVNTYGVINTQNNYRLDNDVVINSTGKFVGTGVHVGYGEIEGGDIILNGGSSDDTTSTIVSDKSLSISLNTPAGTKARILTLKAGDGGTITNFNDAAIPGGSLKLEAGHAAFPTGTNIKGADGGDVILTPGIRSKGNGNGADGENGAVVPGYPGIINLGRLYNIFDTIYALNGMISTSDRREKKEIERSDLGLEFINSLNPVKYKWITGERTHYGLIAQEVEETLKTEEGVKDFAGFIRQIGTVKGEDVDSYGLRYTEFICPMIKAIQELSSELSELKKKLKSQ
ncbi:MAG: tail fiber domain-containing protein [Bacteroidota bacterium]